MRDGVFGESLPFVETVAEAEFLYDVVAQLALVEICEADVTAVLVVVEQVGEVFLRELADVEKGVAFGLRLTLFVGELFLLYLDAIFVCQKAQCVGVGEMLVFHQEMHGVAALAAAEAFENASRRGYGERGGFLVVERAAAPIACSASVQRHKFGYHLLYASGVEYLLNCVGRYHNCIILSSRWLRPCRP